MTGVDLELAAFDAAPDDELLRHRLEACCASRVWVDAIVAGRPHREVESLMAASDSTTAALDDDALAEALAGHPRIGERSGHGGWSAQEQSGVADVGDDVRRRLHEANERYEERFGHVYLVCATGRSAQEMLDYCIARLDNDPAAERTVVVRELAAINRLRLTKMLTLYSLED